MAHDYFQWQVLILISRSLGLYYQKIDEISAFTELAEGRW
jgi:hypothetical protein